MTLDFDKNNGLVPAIIQDANSKDVLMLGYMNREALAKTKDTGKVTFFSRSKNRLWTKGEESGNFLELVSIEADCDQDALLIQAIPAGPTCHTGTSTCWGDRETSNLSFLNTLESVIASRKGADANTSYVASLFEKGINKIAQKVGEEAVETVIEDMDNNDDLFLNESADLLFHYLILLQAKGYSLQDVLAVLQSRQK